MSAGRVEREATTTGFTPMDLAGPFEAVFVLRPTGVPVLGWTQRPGSHEIMSVMGATLWGSLDTLLHALGGESPRSVRLQVEERRMLLRRVTRTWMILIIVPGSVPWNRLENQALKLVDRLRGQGLLPALEVGGG